MTPRLLTRLPPEGVRLGLRSLVGAMLRIDGEAVFPDCGAEPEAFGLLLHLGVTAPGRLVTEGLKLTLEELGQIAPVRVDVVGDGRQRGAACLGAVRHSGSSAS